MTSRPTALLILVALLAGTTAWSSPLPEPRRVSVPVPDKAHLTALLESGLDIISVRVGGQAVILEWPGDASRFATLGLTPTVIDEHPARTAAARANAERPFKAPAPTSVKSGANLLVAPPLGSGSMGGHWTTAEVKAVLDGLVAGDTHGIVADKIDTLGTSLQLRPVWGLLLGKGTGPAVFFNSLTHAREPNSMEAILYFAQDIVSRYNTDPFAKSLLDHRRIYIVPIVNPDGYALNESTYFGSGGTTFGYWRKNLADNNHNGVFNSDSDGVDINRNYGFQWGFDSIGSSPDPRSEVYRGPSAFSELETRIQRDIVRTLQPVTGLSYHTWGDLFIHPWGYTSAPTQHVAAFHEWSDVMTEGNGYQSGQGPDILYPVNGEFNDWCYGDTITKARAYTWTPEAGQASDDFWPPASRIVPLAAENLRACYMTAAIAGTFVQADGYSIGEGALNASYGAHLTVRARNLGLASTTGTVGTLVPLDPGIQMLVSSVSYPTIPSRTTVLPSGGASFEMAIDDTVTPGRLVRFQVSFSDPAGAFSRDTVAIPLGTPTVVAFDDASSGLGKWMATPGTWGIVQNDPAHPSRYFADSPGGPYPLGANSVLTLVLPFNLALGVHAYAVYDARWELECDYDAGTVEASLNGATWTSLNATGTTPGSGESTLQPAGLPVYTGTRWGWRTEMADLSPFTGPAGASTRLRFRVRADDAAQFDGLSFDSLRVMLFDPAAQPALVSVDNGPPSGAVELSAPSPNPVRSFARFEFALPRAGDVRLEVLDVQGRIVRTIADGAAPAGRFVRQWDLADEQGRSVSPSIYFLKLHALDKTITQRFAVIR
jgi:carboxypeptidase T